MGVIELVCGLRFVTATCGTISGVSALAVRELIYNSMWALIMCSSAYRMVL